MDKIVRLRKANKAFQMLDAFTKVAPNMTILSAKVLLHVARNRDEKGNMLVKDLISELQISPTAASRTIHYYTKSENGNALLHVCVDPTDKRRKLLRLTPHGNDFVQSLKEIFEDTNN